jgi:adenylate cyclase
VGGGRTAPGDGLLVEFASIVDAVRCAAEMQRGMLDREPELPDDRRIRLRIGVNLGDVIVDGGDIFGDGVNVAARLEALAEPGGICISGVVHNQIRDKLPYPFEDRGEQSVKNIARPVRAYALHPEAVADLPASSVATAAPRGGHIAPAAIGAAAAAALLIAAGAWWLWPGAKPYPTPMTAAVAPSAPPISPTAGARRMSIVVLPFANLNNDPEQQYFADGFTEDLTTDLSRIPDTLVISRNTAFTYRNKPVDTKQIGRELDVRYVLEGSVRRSGSQFHVNAQLIDAETDVHLWAERFEGDTRNLSAVANDIIGRIAHAINMELVSAEGARHTDNPDALDYILRGNAVWFGRKISRDTYAQIVGLFERALALDPQSVEAQSLLALALVSRRLSFPDFGSGPGEADIRRAQELATKAVAASPRFYLAHFANGEVLRAQRRCRDAIAEYETVLALNRNMVYALSNLGRCKLSTGQVEEVIPEQEQAIRLSPRDIGVAVWYDRIGEVHLLQSRIDEAIHWLEKARDVNAQLPFLRARLAAAYGLKGETEHAAAELAEARRLGGESSYLSLAQMRARSYYEAPSVRALAEATYYAGLRKAGMPEE